MERQLHTKMKIISVGRLVTAFSILHDSPDMHICTVSVGVPMLNEHVQTANSHLVHRFSFFSLISYIVVITSPSSHIFKSACANQQGSFKSLLRALITPISRLKSSSSRGS